jgi:hypothetical protein
MAICENNSIKLWILDLGENTPSYILHTCVFGTYLLGVGGYLPYKKIIRWWHFTCKKPENIICGGILHVNMFHYFKIPSFTFNVFTKFTYNEYIGPYFLSHIVLQFSASDLPEFWTWKCVPYYILEVFNGWYVNSASNIGHNDDGWYTSHPCWDRSGRRTVHYSSCGWWPWLGIVVIIGEFNN